MLKIVKYCQIITLYRNWFRDGSGRWLACNEDPDIDYCNCLDLEQLNLAALWQQGKKGTSDIDFNCHEPYVVNISLLNQGAEKDDGIDWCRYTKEKKRFVKGIKNDETFNTLILNEKNYRLILFLLCTYRANVLAAREKLTEFYLASTPNVFRKYVKHLKDTVIGSDMRLDLSKHIAMISHVLHVYESVRVWQDIWSRSNLYDVFRYEGFSPELFNNALMRKRLEKNLNDVRDKLFKTTFTPDDQFLDNLHTVFKKACEKTPDSSQNTSELTENIKNIADSLDIILKREGNPDTNNTDILDGMRKLAETAKEN